MKQTSVTQPIRRFRRYLWGLLIVTTGPFSVFSVALDTFQKGIPFNLLTKWNAPLLLAVGWMTLIWTSGLLLLLLTYFAETIVLGVNLARKSVRKLHKLARTFPGYAAEVDRLYFRNAALLRVAVMIFVLLGPLTTVVHTHHASETQLVVALASAEPSERASPWKCRQTSRSPMTFKCALEADRFNPWSHNR